MVLEFWVSWGRTGNTIFISSGPNGFQRPTKKKFNKKSVPKPTSFRMGGCEEGEEGRGFRPKRPLYRGSITPLLCAAPKKQIHRWFSYFFRQLVSTSHPSSSDLLYSCSTFSLMCGLASPLSTSILFRSFFAPLFVYASIVSTCRLIHLSTALGFQTVLSFHPPARIVGCHGYLSTVYSFYLIFWWDGDEECDRRSIVLLEPR